MTGSKSAIRKIAFITAAAMISFGLSAQGAHPATASPLRDGAWWRALSEGPSRDDKMVTVVKRMYVSGLIDGAATILSAMSPDEATYNKLADIYLVPTLDPSQIADGIDAYYSDFKNRHDSVGVAFLKVLNQIRVRKF